MLWTDYVTIVSKINRALYEKSSRKCDGPIIKKRLVSQAYCTIINLPKLHGTDENLYKVLFGKPEGKRPFERPRCRWEDIIRMGLWEIK
jgi:hypothetical protein